MANRRLDCLGEACPVPLVKAQRAMNKMDAGDVLIIDTDHSCVLKNVPEWAREAGHNCETEELVEGRWEIHIEKAP